MTAPAAPKPVPPRAIVCPICLKPFTPPVAVRLHAAGRGSTPLTARKASRMPDESGMLVVPRSRSTWRCRSAVRSCAGSSTRSTTSRRRSSPARPWSRLSPTTMPRSSLASGFLEAERKEFVAQIDGQATEIRGLMDAAEKGGRRHGCRQARRRARRRQTQRIRRRCPESASTQPSKGCRAANAKIEGLEKLLAAACPAESNTGGTDRGSRRAEIEEGTTPISRKSEDRQLRTLPAGPPASCHAFASCGHQRRLEDKRAVWHHADQLRQVWNENAARSGSDRAA